MYSSALAAAGNAASLSMALPCKRPTATYEMKVNSVRAKLSNGGDLFVDGGYFIPQINTGKSPVTAIYTAGVWMGGVDRAGNIKLSAVGYRTQGFDYFNGPLDNNGVSEAMSCTQWDKIFTVYGSNIEKHINYYKRAKELNLPLHCDSIPDDVKYWPAQGNKYFIEKYSWQLPDQPLANFLDMDNDGRYDPCAGDYPMIFSVSCDFPYHQGNKIPGEINYFIFNDNGGPHSLSGPNAMQMEFHVNAFAYENSDQVNDMTFYEYKLIHQATEDLVDCYFSWWIDPDIGCYQDDYIGCDPDRNMVYVYNQDAVDGFPSGGCGGYNYFEDDNIPVLGFDFVKGPLVSKVFKRDAKGAFLRDSLGFKIMMNPPPYTGAQDTLAEGGMSSFIYFENGFLDGFPVATIDPQHGRETGFYNYMRGLWSDGTPMTYGGSGYNPASTNTTKYAFPDAPNDPKGWSMCTSDIPFLDMRMVMSTGPMLMQPGRINYLTMSVFSSFYNKLPCPDLTRLRFIDDMAKKLFDDCIDSEILAHLLQIFMVLKKTKKLH
jgi:hypothetical protein